jgi:hypothetical protein
MTLLLPSREGRRPPQPGPGAWVGRPLKVKRPESDFGLDFGHRIGRAERRFEPRQADEVVVAERPHGTYTRQILLGDTLDSENVQANCEHGVFTLTIPVPRPPSRAGCKSAAARTPRRSSRRRLARAGHPRAEAGRRGGADRDKLSCRSSSACCARPSLRSPGGRADPV